MKKYLYIVSLLFVMLLCKGIGFTQTVVTFPPTGSPWSVPAGVTTMTVYVTGAGGGSGGAVTNNSDNASGGGGGGACAIQTITLSGGQVYTITVGAGGTAGNTLGTAGGT